MSESLKREIKQNAQLRKERRRLVVHDDEQPGDLLDDVVISTTNSSASLSISSGLSHSLSTAGPSSSGVPLLPNALSPVSSSSWSASLGISIRAPAQTELACVMIYLDYVFPFLFPFYRPSLLESGRQWLLGMLCQNEVFFHTAASLSSYFFSLVPQSEGREMHEDCKALVWQRLVGQMSLAVKTIHNDIAVLNRPGADSSSLMDKARIMEEITQLLIVEVTVRRDGDWTVHLTPALALFDEIFTTYDLKGLSKPSLAALSALVFFISLLLFVGIVASTSLARAPDLHMYHHSLLSARSEDDCQLRLESVVGCQNWPFMAIGDISYLCAWKRDAKQSGTFSVLNLINMAGPISQGLENGLQSLRIDPPRASTSATGVNRRLEGYYSRHDRKIEFTSIATVTRIWAHTAKLYLCITLSGWQPNSAEVQENSAKVLGLLQTIESPAQLRSLSWPICVAGCLALPGQEDEFRHIVGEVGELAGFGTVGRALRIMETVWRARDAVDRDAVDRDAWNLASALNILGPSVLLI